MPPAIPPGISAAARVRMLGEVIAWACPGLCVSHADLVAALAAAGLDPGVARELAPRHAFSRACKRLSEQRIIRPVAEDASTITFQFTHESPLERPLRVHARNHAHSRQADRRGVLRSCPAWRRTPRSSSIGASPCGPAPT